MEKITPWTGVLWLITLPAGVDSVAGSNLSGQRKLKSLSAPTVDGLWEDEGGEKMDGTTGAVAPTMEEVAQHNRQKQDIITLAKSCRAGLIKTEVLPLANGFMVSLIPMDPELMAQNYVFMRPDRIGTLVHTLYNSDLSNPKAIARLRRLLGYL